MEQEAGLGDAGGGQRSSDRAGTGNRHHPVAGHPHLRHQYRTGIADGGRAGIADQGDALSGLQQVDNALRRAALVVLMDRQQAGSLDGVVRQQVRGVASIFRRHDIDRAQYVQRPQGDVAQISYRGRHYI